MRPADGVEKRCVYWDVSLIEGAENMGVIVRRGEEKDADLSGVRVLGRRQVCLVSGHTEPLDEVPEDLDCMPAGTLAERHVHWVSRNLLLWRLPAAATTSGELCRFQLHSSLSAELSCTVKGLQKADFTLDLLATGTQLPHELIARFPHLSGCTMLRVPDMAQNEAEARGGVSLQRLLQGQLAVSCRTAFGALLDVTGVQLPGVLDEAFWYDGPLGSYEADGGRRALTVWAPTAQNVELLHWRDARGGECHVHQLQPGARGEWTLYHDPGWMWQFYNYRITVYHHQVREVVQVVTTDPYSRCLAGNGERTQILDLHHPHLQPNEWAAHRSPPLASWADISVYEMHIRDFSVHDWSVPAWCRGKYLAFCPEAIKEARGDGELSEGLKHLRELQRCGLNHIHLLPSYDFGSAPERPEEQSPPPQGLARLPPASDEQQRRVLEVADTDAYQWGYDPVHYGTPEGSYATNADGGARVVEFRRMVHGLHQLGLRVVLDVVYNHTFSSGPYDRYSVLDKIVPGYYHRYMENGDTCHSTCCNNTATEHAMCERLVIDDILNWAVNYKVDGFRFDIMGHMMMSTMGKIRAALDRLTLDQDGVDGRGVYLYGEAWDFGEVACNQRGRNASQLNLPGSGLGGFNDRFRDGILGGSPFASPQAQGWVTGLFTRSSSSTASQQPPDSQFDELQAYSQRIKLALAGNLREYELPDGCGGCIKGRHLMIGPVPVAYCQQPWENVLYVGCHDNETLFDAVLMKSAEDLPLQQRADVALLAMAAVAVSQGIAFFHAGDDLLRSKSLDRDSYNSGDWFNRIDWTGQDHTFGSGLPVSTKNYDTWALKGSLLCRSDLKPDPGLIHEVRQRFKALLRIRYSTPLLRLRCADDIMRQLTFPTDDAYQVPGVIVMRIHSSGHPADGTFDPTYDLLLVVLNARAEEVFLPANMTNLQPHPEHASLSEDRLFPHVRVIDNHLRIPPHCIGVFVRARSPSGTTVAPSF